MSPISQWTPGGKKQAKVTKNGFSGEWEPGAHLGYVRGQRCLPLPVPPTLRPALATAGGSVNSSLRRQQTVSKKMVCQPLVQCFLPFLLQVFPICNLISCWSNHSLPGFLTLLSPFAQPGPLDPQTLFIRLFNFTHLLFFPLLVDHLGLQYQVPLLSKAIPSLSRALQHTL